MPSWRNIPSMPKVRASSGTMGTTRSPMPGSFTSVDNRRTKAIVVEISRCALPLSCAAKASSAGTGNCSSVTRRLGRLPPSASRRWRM
jgi:hypothetical protein